MRYRVLGQKGKMSKSGKSSAMEGEKPPTVDRVEGRRKTVQIKQMLRIQARHDYPRMRCR